MHAASIKLAKNSRSLHYASLGWDDNTVGGIFEMRLAETGD